MDINLNWNSHVANVCSRALNNLRCLYRSRDLLTAKTKLYLIQTLIMPLFDCGDAVYGPSLQINKVKSIQKVQNSCIRFAFNLRKFEHILPVLKENNILTMYRRRFFRFCCTIHNIIHKKTPTSLHGKLISRSSIHKYVTRNRSTYDVPRYKLTQTTRSFSVSAAKAWNSLPNAITCAKTLNELKTLLSVYLLNQQRLCSSTSDI